jgi:hypothetical protein
MDDITDATSMIPGYSIIAPLLLQNFGVDVGAVISKYLIFFVFYQGVIYLWERGYSFVQ